MRSTTDLSPENVGDPKPFGCDQCSSDDRLACAGYRQFATITLACSCQCHNLGRVFATYILVPVSSTESFPGLSAPCAGSIHSSKTEEENE